MAQYGISARLTFSNSLIRKEHLADVKCNKLCELLKAASKLHSDYKVTSEYASKDYSIDNSIRDTAFKNGIIVHSDIQSYLSVPVSSSPAYQSIYST